MVNIKSIEIAKLALAKQFSFVTPEKYGYHEILSLQAMAKIGVMLSDQDIINHVVNTLRPFVQGRYQQRMGAYRFYNVGGAVSAYLLWKGLFKEADDVIRKESQNLASNVPRGPKGFFATELWNRGPDIVWIDLAFATAPFLMYSGLYFNNTGFQEEACRQLVSMNELFLDRKIGLYHQCLGQLGPGKYSEDHWSRGNGWGLFALAETVSACPIELEKQFGIRKILVERLKACLKYQDNAGMWHQEMTDHESYTETSGSGLILFALGTAMELGIADEPMRKAFIKGLTGYSSYIALDGSVHNCCTGCMCPGKGTVEDYKNISWKLNDVHAFGPVAHAFIQASKLGIEL